MSDFRRRRSHDRKGGSRPSYARALIVCEGSKTEPHYFDEIRLTFRIPVEIMSSKYGTSPLQVVNYAKDYVTKNNNFEWVFAVFDRDTHASYAEAIQFARRLESSLKNANGDCVHFRAIPSVPCFELWPLLHFQLIENRATSASILAALLQHLPEYTKGMSNLYTLTEKRLDQARRHAERIRGQFAAIPGVDPYTDVDQVLECLLAIRDASAPRG